MTEEDKPKTGCICPNSGFCQRHGIQKSPHLHKLCQNHQGYFDKWEACRGPGQQNIDCSQKEHIAPIINPAMQDRKNHPPVAQPLPGIATQAKNLATSLFNHAKSGFSGASQELQEQRLAICETCPFLTIDKSRCSACGCFVKSKVKMSSSTCPKGYW